MLPYLGAQFVKSIANPSQSGEWDDIFGLCCPGAPIERQAGFVLARLVLFDKQVYPRSAIVRQVMPSLA